jgi:hypothetical protein
VLPVFAQPGTNKLPNSTAPSAVSLCIDSYLGIYHTNINFQIRMWEKDHFNKVSAVHFIIFCFILGIYKRFQKG